MKHMGVDNIKSCQAFLSIELLCSLNFLDDADLLIAPLTVDPFRFVALAVSKAFC